MWSDALALRALLAHEHAHPLAENETVRAARELSVEVDGGEPGVAGGDRRVLHLLADRLCVHAPQEVFANEIAIRAGFGDALFHLDRGRRREGRPGRRQAGVAGAEPRQAGRGRQAERGPGRRRCLLVGDLAGLSGVCAGDRAVPARRTPPPGGSARSRAASRAFCRIVDPAVLPLYEKLRDHYLQLRADFEPAEDQDLGQRGDGAAGRCSPGKEPARSVRLGAEALRPGAVTRASIGIRACAGGALEHDRGSP